MHTPSSLHPLIIERYDALRQLILVAPVAIVAINRQGEIVFVNQKLEELFGYSHAEILGQSIEILLPEELRGIHVQHRAGYVQAPRMRQMGQGLDLEAKRKDGTLFFVEIGLSYLQISSAPFENQHPILEKGVGDSSFQSDRLTGDDLLVLGSIVDITLRKQTEELLEQRVAERTQELEQVYAELEQAAILAERSRIAHDLHDSVTQTLFSASIIADVLPTLWQRKPEEATRRLNDLRELTRGALAEMRTLLLELRPEALANIELPELLRQLASAFIGRTRIPLLLIVPEQCPLEQTVRLALYRIAQEALNNVAKHAEASEASITVSCSSAETSLSIQDNGVGFAVDQIGGNHLGVTIMRERAKEIGATLTIHSVPGTGTGITAYWRQPGA